MSSFRDENKRIFALPLDQQREALLPTYREVYAGFGVNWELVTSVMADDYEFVGRGSGHFPGLPQHVRGREDYVEAQKQMLEVLSVVRVEVEDVLPLEGERVVVYSRFVLRAGDGEINQQILELHEYRDGLVFRQTYWINRTEGEADLGLDR